MAAPSEATVPLVLGGQYLTQIRALETELAKARDPESLGERNPRVAIAEQIEALRKEMAGTAVDFQLRSMPGRQWEKFKFLRPTRAKDEDEDAFVDRFFTWTCQMVSKTVTDPAMSPEQVAELVDQMPGSSWDELAEAAFDLNAGKVSVPFSAAAFAATLTYATE
jgi:hypothetical protein